MAGHVVEVSAPASGTTALPNVEPVDTATPPVLKISRYGNSGQQFGTGLVPTSTGSGTNMSTLLQTAPDGIWLHMGTNDEHFASGTTAANVATYQTNLAAFVAAFQAIKCDVILTAWPSRGYAAPNPGDYESLPWHQAIYEVAEATGCAVFDLMRVVGYGARPTQFALPQTPFYDGVHPTLAGYRLHGALAAKVVQRLAA